jgi:hypothetical protein
MDHPDSEANRSAYASSRALLFVLAVVALVLLGCSRL